jgi:ureidoacrylate peracid hydrolase
MAELADAADSKSAGLRSLGVRFPLPAPTFSLGLRGLAILLISTALKSEGRMESHNFISRGANMRRLWMLAVIGPMLVAVIAAQEAGRNVTLKAKPEPITLDLQRTAVIVVDMQNDFAAKGGMFDLAGIDISPIRSVLPATANAIGQARKAGIKIIYLKMAFQPDLSDAGPHDSPNWIKHQPLHIGAVNRAPNGSSSRILIRDTWDTDIVDELKPLPGDIIIYKHRFSGFYDTDLDATLKRLDIKYLIFAGATTSVCVESTLRDATFRDYVPVLLADTTAEPIGNGFQRTNYDASLLVIQTLFGWVSDSNELAGVLSLQSTRPR